MGAEDIREIKEGIAESALMYFSQAGEEFSAELLFLLAEALIDEYKALRNYPKHFTEEQIAIDVSRYFGRKKAYFAIRVMPEVVGKIGAEGLKSLSDNQVNRVWDTEKYFDDVVPYCEVL